MVVEAGSPAVYGGEDVTYHRKVNGRIKKAQLAQIMREKRKNGICIYFSCKTKSYRGGLCKEHIEKIEMKRIKIGRIQACKTLYDAYNNTKNDPDSIIQDQTFVKKFMGFTCPRIENRKLTPKEAISFWVERSNSDADNKLVDLIKMGKVYAYYENGKLLFANNIS